MSSEPDVEHPLGAPGSSIGVADSRVTGAGGSFSWHACQELRPKRHCLSAAHSLCFVHGFAQNARIGSSE